MYKYEIIWEKPEYIRGFDNAVFRIRALRDFADVKSGDIGGFVSGCYNLSQDGNSWIYDNAVVYGNNAKVCDNARVKCDAKVYDNGVVCDNAVVTDKAKVYNNARVCHNAVVGGNCTVHMMAKVCGNAKIGSSNIKGADCIS